MSSQATLAQLPVGKIGFGAMRITGPGIWEARAIDGDDAVPLGQPFDYPANLKILHHGAVPVQQDKGWPLASLQVMEADSRDIEEVTGWWVVPLRPTCASRVHQSRGSQDGHRG